MAVATEPAARSPDGIPDHCPKHATGESHRRGRGAFCRGTCSCRSRRAMSSVVSRPDAHAQPDACPRRQSLHLLGSSAKACDRDLSIPAPARHDRYREQLQCTADFEAAKAADRCRARWSAVRISRSGDADPLFEPGEPARSAGRSACGPWQGSDERRSEAHTSELQSLMRISYAVFCLKKKNYIHYTKMKIYSI